MRVLLLNSEYPPLGGVAGTAAHTLARGLASRGVMVDVVTAGDRELVQSELLWDGQSPEEGVLTVHRVRCRRSANGQPVSSDQPRAGALSYVVAAVPVVRRMLAAEQHDVVHCFSCFPAGTMLPLLDLHGVPLIVSLAGPDIPGYEPTDPKVRWVHRLGRPLTRWIWRRADRVVVHSESLGRLARKTLPSLRYTVIPNGIDLTRFRPRSATRERSDRIHCLAVAIGNERKGLADLISALASLQRRRYQLEIVGTRPDEDGLRGLAFRLGVAAEVTFTGALDRIALARRYRAADLFALSSSSESRPELFAEALASGLPIVSTAGGAGELIEHGQNGLLVPPGNPNAIAAAIEVLGENPRLRGEMGRRSRLKAEATLAWPRVTTRYLALYSGVVRRAPLHPVIAELPSSSW